MREWNGRYRDDQRGACLVALARRVVVDVLDHRGIGIGLGVYRREEGKEIVNIKQT